MGGRNVATHIKDRGGVRVEINVKMGRGTASATACAQMRRSRARRSQTPSLSSPSLARSRMVSRVRSRERNVNVEYCRDRDAWEGRRSLRLLTWLGEAVAPAWRAPGRLVRPPYQWRRGSLRFELERYVMGNKSQNPPSRLLA